MINKNKFKMVICAVGAIVFFVLSAFVAGLKLAFPFAYSEEISEACQEFGVEPNLVRAVIKVESGFNALAESGVGARGLMQLMPDTAVWIADELEMEDFTLEDLFNPKTNVRMGVFYLKYLTLKYENLTKVLFAYNAGEGRMIEYYGEEFQLKIEDVVIEETKNYIIRVNKAHKGYEEIQNLLK